MVHSEVHVDTMLLHQSEGLLVLKASEEGRRGGGEEGREEGGAKEGRGERGSRGKEREGRKMLQVRREQENTDPRCNTYAYACTTLSKLKVLSVRCEVTSATHICT